MLYSEWIDCFVLQLPCDDGGAIAVPIDDVPDEPDCSGQQIRMRERRDQGTLR